MPRVCDSHGGACGSVVGVEPPGADSGRPWGRTWSAIAVLAVVVGVLYATLPYGRGTDVIGGTAVEVECAAPVVGAWGTDTPPSADELATGSVELDCPGSGRERLVVALAVVVLGAWGTWATRRGRPTASRARSVEPDRE